MALTSSSAGVGVEDGINRTSALYRIAKTFVGSIRSLTPAASSLESLERMHPSLRRQAAVLTSDPRYVALASRIHGDVDSMSLRQTASVAWGLARLYDNKSYAPDAPRGPGSPPALPNYPSLLVRVRDRMASLLEARLVASANRVSKAKGRTKKGAAKGAKSAKGGLSPDDDTSIGIAMWALGRAGVVDARLAGVLVDGLGSEIQDHASETLVSVVWGLAKSPHPGEQEAVGEFMAEALDELGRRMGELSNESLSLMAWAGAKHAADSPVFFGSLEVELAKRDLSAFSAQSLTNILWAFEQSSHFLPHLSPRLMGAVEARLSELSASDVSHLYLWLAQSNLLSASFTAKITRRVQDLLPIMSNMELTKVLLAVASDDTDGMDKAEMLQAFAVESESRLPLLSGTEIAMTTYAFAKASFVAVPLFDEFADAARAKLATMGRHSLAQLAWSYASNGHYSPTLMGAVEERAIELLPGATASDLNMILSSFAKLNHGAPALCDAISAALRAEPQGEGSRLRQEYDTRAATFLGWAFAVLNHWSPEVADLILEHMGTSGARSLLSDESWMQVYQFEAAFRSAPASAVLRGYRTESHHAFTVERPAYSSQLHQEVSRVLDDLGLKHETEFVTDDGMSVIDLVLNPESGKVRIALEVDGPLHFCSNIPQRELGRTVAKRQLLLSSGWHVVQIAYFEWNECVDNEARQRFITQKLQIAKLQSFVQSSWSRKPSGSATAGASDEAVDAVEGDDSHLLSGNSRQSESGGRVSRAQPDSLLRRLVRKWVFGD